MNSRHIHIIDGEESHLAMVDPQPLVFRNTIKTSRFWRRKNRTINLTWKKDAQKISYTPIFIDESGIMYENKQAAEIHLERKIRVPKIIWTTRAITYQGNCSTCGHFYLEDTGLTIDLYGEESDITAPTIILSEDESPSKCTPCTECGGTVQKTARIR